MGVFAAQNNHARFANDQTGHQSGDIPTHEMLVLAAIVQRHQTFGPAILVATFNQHIEHMHRTAAFTQNVAHHQVHGIVRRGDQTAPRMDVGQRESMAPLHQ
ncbi:hypothetical protein A7M48_20305 [Acinetobacter baumannii]|nr:hypothetical protein A7M48_20305 [Acinetobacter baumannii]